MAAGTALEVVVGRIVVRCSGGSLEEGGSPEGYSLEGHSLALGRKPVEAVEVSLEVLTLEQGGKDVQVEAAVDSLQSHFGSILERTWWMWLRYAKGARISLRARFNQASRSRGAICEERRRGHGVVVMKCAENQRAKGESKRAEKSPRIGTVPRLGRRCWSLGHWSGRCRWSLGWMRWRVRESRRTYLRAWMELVWGLAEGWSGLAG